MKINIEYSVGRIYQHQSGQTWVVVQLHFLDFPDGEVEASFPFHNLEGRIANYVREWVAAKSIRNIKTEIEI